LKKKIAATAILMCAVMVLVAGAPLVTADTHHVVKGAYGPRASAVSWNYTTTDSGIWTGHIVNSGLRSLVVDVDDVTTDAASSILHQRIRFAAYPSDTLNTSGALMAKDHTYNITVTPNGPRGTSCIVDDMFKVILPPVAMFTPSVVDATVTVDGSASYDPNGGTITGWGWNWGDGSADGTGVTASHTYTVSNTYTIVLTVLASTGMTGSTSQDVPIVVPTPVDYPPVASFTWSVLGAMVNVVSTSTDDHGIKSLDWNWGDGSAHGTGTPASHTYTATNDYTITLTVTDTADQTNTASQVVHVDVITDSPPVASFTYTTTSWTVNVVSTSTDDYGIKSLDWNWGDGSAHGTVATATHNYAASNTYTITLTVTDTADQTNAKSQDVVVLDNMPVASFTAGSTSWAVTVTSTSTDDYGIVSSDWNWGDGSAHGSDATASHTYAASNIYTITLIVTDTVGQTGVLAKDVVVLDNKPVASFTQTNSSLTVNVVSTSTDDYGIVSYDWDWGDGSAHGSSATATHTYATPASQPMVLGQGANAIIMIPPPPYLISGKTYDKVVGVLLPNCQMTITNTRTGEYNNTIKSDANGAYRYDISALPTPYAVGDIILVSATNANGASGSNTGLVGTSPYTFINVVLTGGSTPVFVDVVITLTVTDTVGQTSTVTMNITLKK